MSKRIGIDLGTTNSVAAICDGRQPRVLESREGPPEIPSAVSVRKKKAGGSGEPEILIGKSAIDNWEMEPKNTIIGIKRLMGRGIRDEEVQKIRETVTYEIVEPSDGTKDSVRVKMAGREYSPVEISTMILRKIKDDAEYRLNDVVTHAVVTVPAYFSAKQKAATRRAVQEAGMKVIKILDEPTAAAIAFGMDASERAEPKTLVVYDLGGGTFDVSVLLMSGGSLVPVNLEGDMWLGGVNYDEKIVDRMLRFIKKEYGIEKSALLSNSRSLARLRQAAQAAKEKLSSSRSAPILMPQIYQDDQKNLIDLDMEITGEQYEADTAQLTARAALLTKKAVEGAHLSSLEEVDYVIMAGNASRSPLVQESMKKLFGEKKVLNKVPPKLSVAMGAAIFAARTIGLYCQAPQADDPKKECGYLNDEAASECARCGKPLVGDGPAEGSVESDGDTVIGCFPQGGIAPFNYGTQSDDDRFNLFITKNDEYPTREPKTLIFYTGVNNQRMVSIPVYGGDNVERASANQKQGEAFAILRSGLPKGTAVKVKLELDSEGAFLVSALLDDGTDLKPWITEGEQDAKAIELIHQTEGILEEKATAVSPDERRELEQEREQVFDRMRKRDFQGGLEKAEALREKAKEAGTGQNDNLRSMARNWQSHLEQVRNQYKWALSSRDVKALQDAETGLSRAIESGNEAEIEKALKDALKKMNSLTHPVPTFIAVEQRIGAIATVDPAQGQRFAHEFEESLADIEQRKPQAADRMNALMDKISKFPLEEQRDDERKCRKCKKVVPASKRYCVCGYDMTALTTMPGGSGEFKNI